MPRTAHDDNQHHHRHPHGLHMRKGSRGMRGENSEDRPLECCIDPAGPRGVEYGGHRTHRCSDEKGPSAARECMKKAGGIPTSHRLVDAYDE
jgi:hypothetical protein